MHILVHSLPKRFERISKDGPSSSGMGAKECVVYFLDHRE